MAEDEKLDFFGKAEFLQPAVHECLRQHEYTNSGGQMRNSAFSAKPSFCSQSSTNACGNTNTRIAEDKKLDFAEKVEFPEEFPRIFSSGCSFAARLI